MTSSPPPPSTATSPPPPLWLWIGTAVTSVVWALLLHSEAIGVTTAGAIVAIALFGMALIARRTDRAPRWRIGTNVWLALPVLAIHLAISYLAIPVATAIVPLIGEQAKAIVATATSDVAPIVVALVAAMLIAPMEEEFWRGTIQPRIRTRVDHSARATAHDNEEVSWRAILVTTGVFCLFHVPTGNIALVGASLLGGIAWGWLRARTGGMLAPVLAHGAWTAAMALFPPI